MLCIGVFFKAIPISQNLSSLNYPLSDLEKLTIPSHRLGQPAFQGKFRLPAKLIKPAIPNLPVDRKRLVGYLLEHYGIVSGEPVESFRSAARPFATNRSEQVGTLS